MKKELKSEMMFQDAMEMVSKGGTAKIQHYLIVNGELIPWDIAIDPVKLKAYLNREIKKEKDTILRLLEEKKKRDRAMKQDLWLSVIFLLVAGLVAVILGSW